MTEAEHQAADDALYARRNNIRIGYADRAGVAGEAVITVSRAHDPRYDGGFMAMGGSWGCGKAARTVEQAVRNLLQDMAHLRWLEIAQPGS